MLSPHRRFFFSCLSLHLCLILSACGGKSTTSTSFETSSFAIGSGADHEVLLYGRHIQTNSVFGKVITGGTITMDLPSGDWSFAMIAWDKTDGGATDTFTGTTRCKHIPSVRLSGGEKTLAFDISVINCSDLLFSASQLIDQSAAGPGEFQPVKFVGCPNLTDVIDTSSVCTSPWQGYKASLVSYKLSPLGSPTLELEELVTSNCHNNNSHTPLRLPSNSRGQFILKITAFQGTGCTGTTKDFIFKKGISEVLGVSRVFDENAPADHTVFFLGDSAPAIIAKDSNQLLGGGPIPAATTRSNVSISLLNPNQFTGLDPDICEILDAASETTITTPCTCSLQFSKWTCSMVVDIQNLTGSPMTSKSFQYRLKKNPSTYSNWATYQATF